MTDVIHEVKGSVIAATVDFARARFGDEGCNQWLAALPSDSQEIVRTPLASSWYDLTCGLIAPTRVLCDLFMNGRASATREIGRYSADKTLTGIYRVLLKLGSPSFTCKKAPIAMMTLYRPGKATVVALGEGTCTVRVHNLGDTGGFVEERMVGFVARALELAGGKAVDVSWRPSDDEANARDVLMLWS